MKKLTADQVKTKDELVARLKAAGEDVAKYITNVNLAITQYNEIVGEVETFRDGVVQQMDTFYDERSEKWQESDAGNAYQSWKDEWEGLDCSEVDEVDEPDLDLMDNLEAVENECSE